MKPIDDKLKKDLIDFLENVSTSLPLTTSNGGYHYANKFKIDVSKNLIQRIKEIK